MTFRKAHAAFGPGQDCTNAGVLALGMAMLGRTPDVNLEGTSPQPCLTSVKGTVDVTEFNVNGGPSPDASAESPHYAVNDGCAATMATMSAGALQGRKLRANC